MAKEIERKFLVNDTSAFIAAARAKRHIVQGYLSTDPDRTVRVRITGDGDSDDAAAFITVKTRNHGATRNEWEYPIPVDDAREMLDACTSTIDKTRHLVDYHGMTWEVDIFYGRHAPLILAEIELPAADTPFDLPPFIGKEVTGDPRYYNSTLAAQ